jgi:hypothetical protein
VNLTTMLILLTFVSLSACDRKTSSPQAEQTAPTLAAVEKTKERAQEIARDAWAIRQVKSQGLGSMSLILSNYRRDRLELEVNQAHLEWLRYAILLVARKGTIIRFEYVARGFNEADLSAPEYALNPAFYLRPRIDSVPPRSSQDW